MSEGIIIAVVAVVGAVLAALITRSGIALRVVSKGLSVMSKRSASA